MAKSNRNKHSGKPTLLSVARAAAILDVSEEQVRAWIDDGTLPIARTVRDERGRRDYLIDQAVLQDAEFIAAVASQISGYRGRNGGAGKKVANAKARNERAHHDEQIRAIHAAATSAEVSRLLQAGYWLSLLNPLARSRWNTIERERLFALQDKLLAALYQRHQSDNWWLLGNGGLEITLAHTGLADSVAQPVFILTRLKVDEEYGSSSEYLSFTIEFSKFRYQFYLPYAQPAAWIEPLTLTRIPQQDAETDSPLMGYAAGWDERSSFSEDEIIDQLATFYTELTGASRTAFTQFTPTPHSRRRNRRQSDEYGFGFGYPYDSDDNEELEYL